MVGGLPLQLLGEFRRVGWLVAGLEAERDGERVHALRLLGLVGRAGVPELLDLGFGGLALGALVLELAADGGDGAVGLAVVLGCGAAAGGAVSRSGVSPRRCRFLASCAV